MAQYKYAHQGYNPELMARAVGRDLGISTKQAIEICNYLRRKPVQRAKTILEEVIALKHPIPFKRFTNGVGHKKGKLDAGRFPQKASKEFLALIQSAEINAQTKGLHTGDLIISHICAHQASRPMHYGRRQREMKRSHVEVVLSEKAKKENKAEKEKKSEPKAEPSKDLKAIKTKTVEPKTHVESKTEDNKIKPLAETESKQEAAQ